MNVYTDDCSGNQYSFADDQLTGLGPFQPEEFYQTFDCIDSLKDEVTGTWKMRLLGGFVRTARGSIKEYDRIVSVLVRQNPKTNRRK